MNYNINGPDFPQQRLFGFVHTNSQPACGVPIGMQDTCKAHILKDAGRFRDVLPSLHPEPSLVVVQSMLWDISHAASLGRPYRNASQIAGWAQHAVDLLRHLMHTAFPCSSIAWRTAPPAAGGARSPALIKLMNDAAKAAIAADAGLSQAVMLIDYASQMSDRIPKRDYDGDEAHPKRPDLLRYACMIFEALETQDETDAQAHGLHAHRHVSPNTTRPAASPAAHQRSSRPTHESAQHEACAEHKRHSRRIGEVDLVAAKELADARRRKQHEQCPLLVKFLQTHPLDKWGKALPPEPSASRSAYTPSRPLSSVVHRSVGR